MTEVNFHRVIFMRDDVMRPCTCTYCLMSWMASSYFIPLSIRANATKTGALCALTNTHTHSCLDMPIKDNNLGCPECVCYLPSPATQWTATQHPGSSWNFFFSRLSQSSTNLLGGGAPSSNGQSWGRKTSHLLHFWQRHKSHKSDACVCAVYMRLTLTTTLMPSFSSGVLSYVMSQTRTTVVAP